ncbi:MAG: 50S ribosomal protein L22 [Gemmatimonadetes bacterium]|nr:50S ribosomal protein L22 [Gemmatimonadota bacterium]
MPVRAHSHMVGVSARKMRGIVDLVRGKRVDEALDILRVTPSPAAVVISKTVRSAAANAENNEAMDRSNLRIVSIVADQGPRLRRFRPKARGRAGAFNRPSCHVTVWVDEATRR